MTGVEQDLARAHKLLAEAAGAVSGMLARKRLSPQEIRGHLPRIEYALTVLHKLQETRDASQEAKVPPAQE